MYIFMWNFKVVTTPVDYSFWEIDLMCHMPVLYQEFSHEKCKTNPCS